YGTVRNEVYSMRNETGDPTTPPPGGGAVWRSANYVFGDVKNLTADTHVQADFRTGPAIHKVLFGVDYQKQDVTSEYRSSFGGFGPFAFGFPLNVYAPVYGQPLPGKNEMAPAIAAVTNQYQVGGYLQDQIKIDRWVVTLTGRYDKAVADTDSTAFGLKAIAKQ